MRLSPLILLAALTIPVLAVEPDIPALIAQLKAEPRLLAHETMKRSGYRTPGAVAAGALAALGDAGIEPVGALAAAQDPVVRANAAYTLARMAEPRAKANVALAKFLADADPLPRRIAAAGLRPVTDDVARAALLKALGDADAETRAAAVWSLAPLDPMPRRAKPNDVEAPRLSNVEKNFVADALAKLTGDAEVRVRYSIARTLGQLRNTNAIPTLEKLLGDADPTVRGAAAEALGLLGSVRAVSALLKMLDDKGDYVAPRAIGALGLLADARAVGALLGCLGADDPRRGVAAAALGQIGDRSAAAKIVPLLRDPEARIRGQAAEALGRLNGPASVPALVAAVTAARADKDDRDLSFVIDALGALNDARAIEPLVDLLFSDPEPSSTVQMAIERSLPKIKDPRVVSALAGRAMAKPTTDAAFIARRTIGHITDNSGFIHDRGSFERWWTAAQGDYPAR